MYGAKVSSPAAEKKSNLETEFKSQNREYIITNLKKKKEKRIRNLVERKKSMLISGEEEQDLEKREKRM